MARARPRARARARAWARAWARARGRTTTRFNFGHPLRTRDVRQCLWTTLHRQTLTTSLA